MELHPLGIWTPPRSVEPRRQPAPALSSSRGLGGGRLSVDKSFDFFGSPFAILSPSEPDDDWRRLNLDSKTLNRLSPSKLLELLTDLSPDVSRALWDFLRMCNPGWTIKVTRPGSERVYKRGDDALKEFFDLLEDYYGSLDLIYSRLYFSAFLRGAMLSELVLDPAGREPVDLVTPDPHCVRFRVRDDERRGRIWQLGQWQRGQWVDLDRQTIRYVAIDPMPDRPYGRPMASPAIFSTLFLLGLLHDLRRVIAQQGYPRIDLVIELEKLTKAMPSDLENDPEKVREWVAQVIKEVETAYGKLQPDDAYVHTDVVKVEKSVGTVDSRSLGAVEGIVRTLERLSIRALKTMPLLMGVNESTTETHAAFQYEVHSASIRALQHPCETMMGRQFALALQAQGIAASVQLRFAEMRAAKELRDAQVQEKKISNAARKRDEGWITQDEAAQEVTGHAAVEPEPLFRAGNQQPQSEPEPDANMRRPTLTAVK
ncbi:MAG: hypothetical protein AB1631_17445 [Acidobacteriota bacterium]